jgi:ABC-type Zn uptake system ZnuABC Zn-binding protein ZnuA
MRPRRPPAKGKPGHLPALWVALLLSLGSILYGCGGAGSTPSSSTEQGQPVVLADTSFLADIAQNVAGDRLNVSSLVPLGADPHSFEPTPQDARRVAECHAFIINAAGLIPTVDDLIAGAGADDLLVIEASSGLAGASDDPHFWLDPLSVVTYVDNIATGLATIDPGGVDVFRANAEAYSAELRALDTWIVAQVATIPAERRLLVTNHESFGHFAARYGFEIVGTVFPTTTGEGSPSARQLADLIDEIRVAGAPAVFLETGSNADLADQVAEEAGIEVVTDLYTHSLGENASTYLDMMRWNVGLIVEALR